MRSNVVKLVTPPPFEEPTTKGGDGDDGFSEPDYTYQNLRFMCISLAVAAATQGNTQPPDRGYIRALSVDFWDFINE
jgi:hypothetical protein